MREEVVLVGLKRGKLFEIQAMDRKGQRSFKKYAILSWKSMYLEDWRPNESNIIVWVCPGSKKLKECDQEFFSTKHQQSKIWFSYHRGSINNKYQTTAVYSSMVRSWITVNCDFSSDTTELLYFIRINRTQNRRNQRPHQKHYCWIAKEIHVCH